MISSITNTEQANADVDREKRALRLKRYVIALFVLVLLSGLGFAAYHVYIALTK